MRYNTSSTTWLRRPDVVIELAGSKGGVVTEGGRDQTGARHVLCPFRIFSHVTLQAAVRGASVSAREERRLPEHTVNSLQVTEAWGIRGR